MAGSVVKSYTAFRKMLTLAETVQLPAFKSARLLTTQPLLLNREVKGVSVIEVPVEDFIRADELVLSTAMNIGHDAALMTQFVGDVAVAGATALAVSIGPYASGFPAEALAIAEEHQLALLELPWEVRFSDLTEAVLRRILEEQLEAKHRDEFLWSLANGTVPLDQAHAKAKRYGFDLSKPYVVMVAHLREENVPSQLVYSVQQRAASEGLESLCALLGQQLLLCLPTLSKERLVTFCNALAETFPRASFIWGVGEDVSSPEAFAKSYGEARIACDVGLKLQRSRVTFASDIALDKMLLRLKEEPESRQLYVRYLEPLITYQRESDVQVLETLQTYLECQGNVTQTAEKLGVHRQTLLYRLEKLEAIGKMSLKSRKDVLALELCLRVYGLEA
ncbi:MAG: PucR family transcriptional regulator [Trueperaceae bacterium]